MSKRTKARAKAVPVDLFLANEQRERVEFEEESDADAEFRARLEEAGIIDILSKVIMKLKSADATEAAAASRMPLQTVMYDELLKGWTGNRSLIELQRENDCLRRENTKLRKLFENYGGEPFLEEHNVLASDNIIAGDKAAKE